MNLDERVQLRRFNARQPFGPHSRRPQRWVNWWALILPCGLFLGAALMVALAQIGLAWVKTL